MRIRRSNGGASSNSSHEVEYSLEAFKNGGFEFVDRINRGHQRAEFSYELFLVSPAGRAPSEQALFSQTFRWIPWTTLTYRLDPAQIAGKGKLALNGRLDAVGSESRKLG